MILQEHIQSHLAKASALPWRRNADIDADSVTLDMLVP